MGELSSCVFTLQISESSSSPILQRNSHTMKRNLLEMKKREIYSQSLMIGTQPEIIKPIFF